MIILKILQIRAGSDSILLDQDWTRTEKLLSLFLISQAKQTELFCISII